MFEVDACYKIMFESMFEQCELKDIVEKISFHIHASALYVLNSGKVPAYACTADVEGTTLEETLKKGHITLSEFDQYKEKGIEGESLYLVRSDVKIREKTIGYSVIIYKEADLTESMQSVCDILSQISAEYFSEEDIEIYGNTPMRKMIYEQAVFQDDVQSLERLQKDVSGDFMEVLFLNVDAIEDKVKLFLQMQNTWNICGLLIEKHTVAVVFCNVNHTNQETITEKLERMDTCCCVSERFTHLNICKRKKALLRRMSLLQSTGHTGKVIEEREEFTSLIYTYALPVLQETGLRDYSVELLMEEDHMNNTELYDTLKTYLLCENSISETAKKLHIHRNTLVYRLKQIREIVDKDINDNKVSREMLSYMMLYDIARQIEVK